MHAQQAPSLVSTRSSHTPHRTPCRARDPQTRIISFTVTEAGYTSDLSSEIAQFSQPPPPAGYAPTTLYGALAVLLEARRVAGAGKVTLLCCDNLRNNGERSRAGLLDFLRKTGADDLCAWVEANTTSPSTMVDRITPRPTAAVRERVRAATGTDDPAALMAESFIQWVVEDNFCSGRPAWEAVGAQLVPDVHPFEEAKIRILNATHSLVAWAGTLLGLEFIHEDVQTPAIRDLAVDYINNSVIPLLTPSPLDLAAYRDSVLERFASPHVKDSNARVAMDGFAKTTGFIAPTLRQHLAKGAKAADPALGGVALLPAFFLAYLQVWHRNELPHKYDDAAMDPAVGHAICAVCRQIVAVWAAHGRYHAPHDQPFWQDADPVAALSGCAALWGDLAGNDVLTEAIRIAYMRVQEFQAQNSN